MILSPSQLKDYGFNFKENHEYEEMYEESKRLVDPETDTLFDTYNLISGMTEYSLIDNGYYFEFCVQAHWMDTPMVLTYIETIEELESTLKVLTKEFPKNNLFNTSKN